MPTTYWGDPPRRSTLPQRLRDFVLGAVAALSILPAPNVGAQALTDEQLLSAMIATVVAHDLGIPIGLLPFPLTQLAGETAQYVGNLGLKSYRPWLMPSKDGKFDNLAFLPYEDDDNDSCSYHFYLPSATAEYENLFGIIPIRPPYYDERTNTSYLWAQRWGVLTPPRIYHANSTARLSVRSAEPVRRYDATIGAFMQFDVPFTDPVEKTEYYYPILDAYSPSLEVPRILGVPQRNRVDQDGQLAVSGPQEVYLPIGEHTMEWAAATQLNAITDVIVPGLLLAAAVHSEFKTAKGGLPAAKKVKQSGIGDDVVDQADNAADTATALAGKKRFDSIWQAFITKNEPGPIGKKFVKKFGDKIARSLLCPVIAKAALYGVSVLEAETGALLESQGQLTDLERKALDVIHRQVFEARLPNGIDALKTLICEQSTQGSDLVKLVVGALLRTFGLEAFVTSDTGVSYLGQRVRIWDDVPPVWDRQPLDPIKLEATDFGGTRRYRYIAALRAAAAERVSDNCGRLPELLDDTPPFLPLGETTITWTARDQGPNPDDGKDYAPISKQTIIVEDTQPPLLLAPPSKVIEATTDLMLTEDDFGSAVAVDLADVQPVVANDAPALFPLDQRRTVQWTATDQSGNTGRDSQLITVKTEGTNTRPVADDNTAVTLTAEPVDIRLTAEDFDILDGRADPLWFEIEAYPQNGEFIAPLLPFFIEDYRTRPNDGLGQDYDPVTDEIFSFIATKHCRTDLPRSERIPPRNFVHQARFVHVTDDGVRYVLDEYFTCDQFSDRAFSNLRFSQWTAAGQFLGQLDLGSAAEAGPVGDTFRIDRDGFLYYNKVSQPGSSSNEMQMVRCSTDDWQTSPSVACNNSYKFENSSIPGSRLDVRSLADARIDSRLNVAYVVDGFSIFAFELLQSGGTRYLGELGPVDGQGIVLDEWFGKISSLEVGSDGSLYVADGEHHRIHKIAPITNVSGEFELGDYVGWAGRCTGSGNKACDEASERSRGYSCTFEPGSCTPTLAERTTSAGRALFFGAGQGQFDTPRYLAIDPNDVLYIADYENERVQRLSVDGSFAGEAVSDGSGINKGDRPSFVLGNMGKPASVSVNSRQFYVVDRDEQFLHVFGTLPFKDITDDAVTVTYVSDQDFPRPNDSDVDAFTFSVSDGLAVSDPALVSITVNRNFRPPVALPGRFTTDEDTPLEFELPADDPDGIAGRDFLGLDTLTYTVTAGPQHGTLSDDGTYTPDPDFYGEDALRFKVNDGREDSNEGTVIITVTPVNDPPVVTIEVPERVALGFPALVTSSFIDDPSDGYEATVSWGDGQVEETGGFVEDDQGVPYIEGVVVSEPPMPEIEGRTSAEHIYETLGRRMVEICVIDSGSLSSCDSAEIIVEDLVSLGIGGRVYAGPLAEDEITQQQLFDDQDFTYEVTIVNELRLDGTGLTAEGVVLEADLPDLAIGVIESSRGTCARNGTALACALGDLEPGAEVTLTIAAFGPGNLACNEDFDLNATLTTLSEALEGEMDFALGVELVADVSNLADDDLDGHPNACDNCPGVPNLGQADSLGDGVGDACDQDRDGVSSDPLAVEPDNCPDIFNADQMDSEADGIGDACDNCTHVSNDGQTDSDGDGFGNACDGDFDQKLPVVGFPDLAQMRQALGKNRDSFDCLQDDGTPGGSCAEFDLDGELPIIGDRDLARFRELLGKPPGPRCEGCPLPGAP